MKCDDCLNILEAYVDHESTERETEQVREHLITCTVCTSEFEALSAERELYARYDREVQTSPATWNGIAARIAAETPVVKPARTESRGWFAGLFAIPRLGFAFSGAAAVLIAAFAIGYLFLRTNEPVPLRAASSDRISPTSTVINPGESKPAPDKTTSAPIESQAGQNDIARSDGPRIKKPASGESDVLLTDVAYEDRETASHLERAQNLLTSFRTLQTSDDGQEVDVSYEKAESRKLLNENVVLRRDAETAGKFPAKAMLGSLEPFLIDIANLPEKATAREVQQIKDRVQRTEIVAELRSY
jgi:putative zinc finger protein